MIDHLDLDRLKNREILILGEFSFRNLTFVSVFIVVNLLVIVFVIVVIVSVFLAVFRIVVVVFVIIGILRLRFRPRIRGCYGRNSEYQKW